MRVTRAAIAMLGAAAAATVLLTARETIAQPRSVWDGVFTMEQAARGEGRYRKECSSCHGAALEGDGGFAPALIAEAFTDRWQDATVGDVLIVVKASMPQDRPASLGPDVYADIVAFMLKMNNYPAGRTELSTDPAQSQDIRIAKSPTR